MKGDYIVKKMFTKLMSAFLALVVVLGVGAMPAFAAENTDVPVPEEATFVAETISDENAGIAPASTVVLDTYVKFNNYVDTVQKYFSGSTVILAMSDIHPETDTSGNTFNVTVYRVNSDGSKTQVAQTGTLSGYNNNCSYSWNLGAGTYVFRFKKLSGSVRQCVDSVTLLTA